MADARMISMEDSNGGLSDFVGLVPFTKLNFKRPMVE
jgi:hypothetical protein